MEYERRPSPPPLLAYTASKLEKTLLKNAKKSSSKGKTKAKPLNRRIGVSETYRSNVNVTSRPRLKKPQGKIEFDESARRDYLTGFHKRKQERLEKGKEKAKEREKLEKKLVRQEAREARKKQAAENVAAEKQAYGDLSEADSVQDEQDAIDAPSYEDEQHHTTVVVADFDPNAPEDLSTSQCKKPKVREALPPSSRRMTKKLKNSLSGAREISRLLDSDEEELEMIQERDFPADSAAFSTHTTERKTGVALAKPKRTTFHYESKSERAKARSDARETKNKWAEKRREERKMGLGKPRLQKNKGKRGHGNKGTKRK